MNRKLGQNRKFKLRLRRFRPQYLYRLSRSCILLFACVGLLLITSLLLAHRNNPEDPRSVTAKFLGLKVIPYCLKRWIARTESRSSGPVFPISKSFGLFGFDEQQDTQVYSSQRSNSTSESIYVISLPGRPDRRAQMELLRVYMGLEWSYVSATSKDGEVVEQVMQNVDVSLPITLPFRWPSNLDVKYAFPDLTDVSFLDNPHSLSVGSITSNANAGIDTLSILYSQDPLVVATKDFILTPSHPNTPKWKVLTKSRVACWHSHLQVIQRVVHEQRNDHGKHKDNEITIILEDDIDMEADIRQRLETIWDSLPIDWDILFLGHCWSDETHYPALSPRLQPQARSSFHETPMDPGYRSKYSYPSLHPSYAPKCTHAYALSPNGARKILAHLSYPPFAYSRAIDQAFAWLVKSKRIKAYSVVPSVIVQRKDGKSDVWLPGVGDQAGGSEWRDALVFGVFGTRGEKRDG
ncbi:hypothetical protein K435DRAFT_680030 [Dendrothele bispora CBS 962.96]|uniref:Glycosyl transferase family 25 domain-containing protein n=1 Tax=Dendrothele bispora (strain CBS 962.96) TaxID=1314807 RepID=A0A4S8LH64_DENBC|nr:hypothetical protein K435DRAFT_680030 [Dendrothele bispora CBS 962.96]